MVHKEAYIRSTAWANVWIPGCDYCQTILRAILGMWVGVWPHTITLLQSIKRSEWTKNKSQINVTSSFSVKVCLFVFAAGSDLPWNVCAAACSADVWKIWEWTSDSSYLIGIVFAMQSLPALQKTHTDISGAGGDERQLQSITKQSHQRTFI